MWLRVFKLLCERERKRCLSQYTFKGYKKECVGYLLSSYCMHLHASQHISTSHIFAYIRICWLNFVYANWIEYWEIFLHNWGGVLFPNKYGGKTNLIALGQTNKIRTRQIMRLEKLLTLAILLLRSFQLSTKKIAQKPFLHAISHARFIFELQMVPILQTWWEYLQSICHWI